MPAGTCSPPFSVSTYTPVSIAAYELLTTRYRVLPRQINIYEAGSLELIRKHGVKPVPPQFYLSCLQNTLEVVQYLSEECGFNAGEEKTNMVDLMFSWPIGAHIPSRNPDDDRLAVFRYLMRTQGLKPTKITLCSACKYSPLKIVRFLVETGLALIPGILEEACHYNRNLDVIQYLVEEQHLKSDRACMVRACYHNPNSEIVNYLIQRLEPRGLDQFCWRQSRVRLGAYDLNRACSYGNFGVVKYLVLRCGLKPSAQDLHDACTEGEPRTLQFLVESCGLKPQQEDVDEACRRGNIGNVDYLIRECELQPSADVLLPPYL